ncbi:MAG TPA: VWA domain-containing protein [Pyrinomonadaceae bacterium]|nr:VWA domain-containing protein [Pyrinomonadaceae bacterium]
MRWKAFLTLVVAALVLPVRAQQPPKQDPPAPWRVTTPVDPSQQDKRQSEDDDEVVRITTNLVQIDAVVTKDNKLVTGLTEDDFEVLEDGKPQFIKSFSFVSMVKPADQSTTGTVASAKAKNAVMAPPPTFKPNEPHRTIAFVYDDIGSSAGTIGQVRKQIRKFIEEEMQPNDLVAIIRTGGEVGALQQFTNDKRILLRAVENFRYSTASRLGVSMFPSGMDSLAGGSRGGAYAGQSLEQSLRVLRFILLGMREIPGRKSMILLSEHFPRDTMFGLPPDRSSFLTRDTISSIGDGRSMFSNYRGVQRLAELAIRSSVVIYGVDIRGLVPFMMAPIDTFSNPNPRPAGDQPFQALRAQSHWLQDSRAGQDYLARETGGFVIKNSNNYFRRITEDQTGYYLIGYRPTETTFNRSFHKITVRVKRPGLTVRTRSGFYGMTDEDTRPMQLTGHDRLNMALMSPLGASDVEVHLTALFAAAPKVGSLLRSLIHFSAQDLEFIKEPGGQQTATLNLAAIVFGDNGNVIEQLTETRSIRVDEKDLDRLRADGLVYQFDVPLKKPGAYQFRVAVRDANSSQIGTARQFVEVPDLKKNVLTLSGITVSLEAQANSSNSLVTDLRNAAIRRFPPESNLWFGYIIYNARTDKAGASLTAQSRVFQDGKLVHEGEPQPIDFTGQSDLKRISTGGGLKLGKLPAGEYQLQLVVREQSSGKEKPRVAWQMIDFEIVK